MAAIARCEVAGCSFAPWNQHLPTEAPANSPSPSRSLAFRPVLSSSRSSFAASAHRLRECLPQRSRQELSGRRRLEIWAQDLCGIAGTSKWGDRTTIDLEKIVKVQGDVFLGVDFGGTGVKAAPVDVTTGELQADRHRIPTPQPATPEAIAGVIKQLVDHFGWKGVIGVGVPAVVRRGVVYTAANIDKTWVNINAQRLFEEATGCPVVVLNDADAAGLAEMNFGAGRGHEEEVVLVTTFGTGIGTALYVEGKLVPNLELGHIEMDGEVAEKLASAAAREREDLGWKKWAGRVNQYLGKLERLLSPDLIIMGGGVSKKDDKFSHYLELPMGTPIVMAAMRNEAGIVGAALGAHYKYERFVSETNPDIEASSEVNGVEFGSKVHASP